MEISQPRFLGSATGAITRKFAQHGAQGEDDMQEIDDQTFAKLVAEEVKNKLSPKQRKVLLERHNWERWRQNLVALLDNLDRQISLIEISRATDTERYESFGNDGMALLEQAHSSYDARAKKISRFRFHVERRLNEVAAMIETGEVTERNGWDSVDFLRRGIARHRALLREYDMEETVIDRALWSLLDDRWEFDNIRPTDVI